MPKSVRLNIFLLKAGTRLDQVIRDGPQGVRRIPLRQGLPFDGALYVSAPRPHPPAWVTFLREATETQFAEGLLNQGASCLIALRVQERVFAISFGFASHWIDDARIVRRFGMMVALNAVHSDSLRSVDREELDTVPRKTRSQTTVSSAIEGFGINIARDLVRSVTGQPRNRAFATQITGSDNLIVNAPTEFTQLGAKCLEALEYYGSEDYRERYAWIDNFVRIEDPDLVAVLDNRVVQALNERRTDNIFLSPPGMMDTQEHVGFKYPRQKSTPVPDLRLSELLNHLGDGALTVAQLRSSKIRQFTTNDLTEARKFSVYDSLIYEETRDNVLYILTSGDWFQVNNDHVLAVNQEIDAIPYADQLNIADAQQSESETIYNARAARASGGRLALFDANPIMYGDGRSRVEICDLLSIDRHFIHVKAKTKSAALSHLFAQGLVSAQALRDPLFRQGARQICPASHLAVFDDQRRPDEYVVVYAIMTTAAGDLRAALPFFSKQSLANASKELRLMGYQVQLKKISVA